MLWVRIINHIRGKNCQASFQVFSSLGSLFILVSLYFSVSLSVSVSISLYIFLYFSISLALFLIFLKSAQIDNIIIPSGKLLVTSTRSRTSHPPPVAAAAVSVSTAMISTPTSTLVAGEEKFVIRNWFRKRK